MNSSIFLDGSPININGGYRHPKKGFQVEINVEEGVKSVPFSNIAFPDMVIAEGIFIETFGMTFNEAKARSRTSFMPIILSAGKIIPLEKISEKVGYTMIVDPYETEDEIKIN